MATSLEELRVLKDAEAVADGIWKLVVKWEPFARDVVGKQLARGLMAADQVQHYALQLTEVARRLNAFANSIKDQRRGKPAQTKVREAAVEYVTDTPLQ